MAGAICRESFSGGAGGRPEGAAAGHFQPIAFSSKDHGADSMENCSPRLRAGGHGDSHANAGVPPAIAFETSSSAEWGVRRISPRECERLQGFPDDWTAIPWRGKAAENCPDGPRYKAIGNSMAVNVMCWIGERIHLINSAIEGE
jgi:DNA (cytosine-5)-methyltransferase 1